MFHPTTRSAFGSDRVVPAVLSRWTAFLLIAAVSVAIFSAASASAAVLPSFKLHYIDSGAVSWNAHQVTLADYNGDGKLDWTVGDVHGSPNTFNLYTYNNADSWTKSVVMTSNIDGNFGSVYGGAAAINVNGDTFSNGRPKMDVITSNWLFVNSSATSGGTPTFTKYNIGTAPTSNTVHDHQAVDINGDGKLDILTTSGASSTGIYWYQAPTTPTNTWTQRLITTGLESGNESYLHAATNPDAAGDLNGDGRIDVVGARGWFENTPGTAASGVMGAGWTGHWDSNVFLGVNGTYGTGVRTSIRDLTGDGRLDIVQAECDTSGTTRLAWIKNNSNGTFTRNLLESGTYDYHNLAVADFNRDGRMDIMTGAGPLVSSHGVWIWLDTATSGNPVYAKHNLSEFLSAADVTKLSNAFASDHVHEPTFGDVDGNGSIDLVLKGWNGGAPFMYMENTTAAPEPSSLVLLGIGAISLVAYGWRRRKQSA